MKIGHHAQICAHAEAASLTIADNQHAKAQIFTDRENPNLFKTSMTAQICSRSCCRNVA